METSSPGCMMRRRKSLQVDGEEFLLSGYDELPREIKGGLPRTVAIWNVSRRSVVIILSGLVLDTKQPLQIRWDDRAE